MLLEGTNLNNPCVCRRQSVLSRFDRQGRFATEGRITTRLHSLGARAHLEVDLALRATSTQAGGVPFTWYRVKLAPTMSP